MPGIARLNRDELSKLIEITEAQGGNATELKNLLAEVDEDTRLQQPARRRYSPSIWREEELTTEERLNEEAGDLFPNGITADILRMCIEYDGKFTLKELKVMCKKAGFSPSGHKKLLAAKLIAHQRREGRFEISKPAVGQTNEGWAEDDCW